MVDEKENDLKLSIIIINWNGEQFINQCLNSIAASDLSSAAYEIIFADNLSTDNSVSLVKGSYPRVRLLEFDKNYGFCKGNNLAAAYAKGDVLFFLNNDTKIGPDALGKMLAVFESDKQIAVCGCRMMNYSGSAVFHTGIGIDVMGWPVRYRKLFYVEGSAMMIRKSVFNELEGFDEDYFMFYEDVDLCWRARLAGYRIAAASDAVVYHFMGAGAGGGESAGGGFETTLFRRYHSERNTISTLLKNYSTASLIFIMPLYFLVGFSEIILFSVLGKFKMVSAYFKAYQWNIRNISKIFSKRTKIQRRRKVSDLEIFKNMYKLSGKLLILREFGIPKINGGE